MKILVFLALFSLSSFVSNTNPETITVHDQHEVWLYSFMDGTAQIKHLGSDYTLTKGITSGKNKIGISDLPAGTSSIALISSRGKLLDTIYIKK